ncbi:MAG: tRNA-dihydrouridine synthase family protein [Candidatus Electryonea clarkiae]|nr:tRNA-dihydrouridine synthase family protein [Candidatus Electryonea clarkiae]MDP8285517.1 tRNA-dihydrouridine synthase family protein [Candidatus Electryonea clarkiae]
MQKLNGKNNPWFERRPLVALAPMEAITDNAYRTLVRRISSNVILYTEFVPCKGLLRAGDRVWKIAEFDDSQRPIIVQVYDNDLEAIRDATSQVAKKLRPEGIDLNMGCPVRKVVARGAGCGMMADPDNAADAIKIMVDSSDGIPVSAKMRLGITNKNEVIEVAQKVVEAGAVQVSIHGRLKAERPRIRADWDAISAAGSAITATVMGNGDIWSVEDANEMAAMEGIDGVMIGRGAIGNPWLLHRTCQALAGETVDPPPDKKERIRIALEHLELNVIDKGERRGVLEMRKVIRNYIKGYHDSRRTWMKIITVVTHSETANILEDFAENGDDMPLHE